MNYYKCLIDTKNGLSKGSIYFWDINTQELDLDDSGTAHHTITPDFLEKKFQKISKKFVKKAYKLTEDQYWKDTFPKYWEKKVKEINLEPLVELFEGLSHKCELDTNCLMWVRSYGKYKDKGFYLGHSFNWEIVEDEGSYVLIPTIK